MPEKYKFFLLKYNGGRTIKTKFRNSVNVRLLYPLKSENGYDLLTIINYENTEKIIDLGFFPIGETEFGDYICIRIQDDNSIWLITHDKYEKNKKLTDSFEEFVNECNSEKIEHVSTMEERWERVRKAGNEDKITPEIVQAWQREIDRLSNIKQEEVLL